MQNRNQFAYQDSINKEQLKSLHLEIDALNQQSLIALKQAQLYENKFYRDSLAEEDTRKNSQVQFFIELNLSKLKFRIKLGFYHTIELTFKNISNRVADNIITGYSIVPFKTSPYFHRDEFVTPGQMKPNESRMIELFDLPIFHKKDTVAIVAILKCKDKITNKPFTPIGCVRMLTAPGNYSYPMDMHVNKIMNIIKAKDSSFYNQFRYIDFQ